MLLFCYAAAYYVAAVAVCYAVTGSNAAAHTLMRRTLCSSDMYARTLRVC